MNLLEFSSPKSVIKKIHKYTQNLNLNYTSSYKLTNKLKHFGPQKSFFDYPHKSIHINLWGGYTIWTKNKNIIHIFFLPEYRLYDSLEQRVHLHSKGALLFSFRSYCMRALNQLLHFGVLEWDCEWSYNKPISLVRLKSSHSSLLDTEKWRLHGQDGCPENPGAQPQAEVDLSFLTINHLPLHIATIWILLKSIITSHSFYGAGTMWCYLQFSLWYTQYILIPYCFISSKPTYL